jgi:aspartate/methionine/tyrosine aminotransferase
MRIERDRYLDWARRRFDESPPAFNLAVSGLQAASPAEAGIDPSALRIAGNNAFGHPGLRKRIAEQYGVPPSHVLVAQGTSGANFLLLAAMLRDGDAALCEKPAYEPLWRTIEMVGGQVRWIPREASCGYQPDPAVVAAGFERGARLCVLSDLHNPTAALLSRDLVREIGRIAAAHDGWLLIDEVYLSGVFESPVTSGASLDEHIVITASLTKTYGVGGLRAGWAIAPPAIVERGNDIIAHVTGNPPFIADEAACMAMDHLPQLRARAQARRAENWPLVRDFAQAHGLLETEPAGAFIAWLKLPEGLHAERFVDHLSAKYDTLVVPGTFFGVPDHVRLGFGQPKAVMEEGLRRIGAALKELGSAIQV